MPPARILLWVASLGGVAVLVRTIVAGPLPTWLAALLFTAYLVIVVTGLMRHQLEMFGDVLWRGAPGTRGVVLTVEGPLDAEVTSRILERLGDAEVTAVFFVTGRSVKKHPDAARAVRAAGHELAILGWDRARWYAFRSPRRVHKDLERCREAVAAITGFRPALFRPPDGRVFTRTSTAAKKADVTVVGWTVDLSSPTAATLDRVTPGSFVRFAVDASPEPVGRLDGLLEGLRRRSLRVVPLRDIAVAAAPRADATPSSEAAAKDEAASAS